MLFYKTNKFSGEIESSKEGNVWWEYISNFSNLKLSNDMENMLRVFLEDDLSEFFYYKNDDKWLYELK